MVYKNTMLGEFISSNSAKHDAFWETGDNNSHVNFVTHDVKGAICTTEGGAYKTAQDSCHE